MTEKIKVGTKVKIREDLKIGEYGTNQVEEGMIQYRGKETEILEVMDDGEIQEYLLEIDNKFWCWTSEMFE